MDFYRLRTSLSFKICLIVVFLMNLADGPVTKGIFYFSKMLLKNSDTDDSQEALEQLGEWKNEFHFGNLFAGQLGTLCTVVFLLCIVYFCFGDIQNGYIKNIAGQLPSRGYTIISKFVVIQFTIIMFYLATVIGGTIGQLLIGSDIKFDLLCPGELNLENGTVGPDRSVSIVYAFAEFGIKFLLLSGICSLILLFTTAVGSNVAGTVTAVLCGFGFTGVVYAAVSVGISKLFKLDDFELSEYMPDSLYRTDLISEGFAVRALIIAIITIAAVMFVTTKLYDKKDIA